MATMNMTMRCGPEAGASASAKAALSNGMWQGDHPLQFSLPLLILQICLVLFITRLLAFLIKPLRQPRVIAEIIGGILLGPSALGHSTIYMKYVFPKSSLLVLDTVANLGLMFFLFLVGLELDLRAIQRTGGRALSIAAAGICVPFAAGVGVSIILHNTIATNADFAPFIVFMGVAMSITAFAVLARILAERKLLTTDVGEMAMAAAALNDVAAWILLALAVALSGSGKSPLIAIWVMLCGLAYVCVMFLVVKPILSYMAKRAVQNEPVNELHVAMVLAGVLASGFVTDAMGIHVIFGAFVFGLIIPKQGPLARILIEKIEDLTTILLLPLYFASSGLKTNIGAIHGAQSIGLVVLVIATACLGKILGTFVVASLHKMNFKKALTLGFLMNTKGLVELIVLNIGKDRKVLNDETFAIMVLMALFTTFITTPAVVALYKPARNAVPYKHKTLDMRGNKEDDDDELRVLACVHGMQNVHAIINLVEVSRGVRKRPLRMYIMHLLQLTERPLSIMRLRQDRRNGLLSEHHDTMDSVILAFEAYGQLSKVTVKAMTTISNLNNIHEDICATAGEKRVTFVVLPFHKHIGPTDGIWEGINLGLRSVNQKVLLHAPCSVGILVDRGLGMQVALSSTLVHHHVAVLFFGGPDDREALAFGCRIVEHPGVKLKVFRFVHKPLSSNDLLHISIEMPYDGDARRQNTSLQSKSSSHGASLHLGHETYDFMETSGFDMEQERKLDNESLAMVKDADSHTFSAESSIVYEEKEARSALEAAVEVGNMKEFSLLLLGRGRRPSPMIGMLSGRRAEFSELGPVGDALVAQSSLHVHSSLLVIQQHDPALVTRELPCGI